MATLCLAPACDESPLAPSAPDAVEQFLESLRQQELDVTLSGGTNSNVLPFFTTAARPLLVNGSTVHVFAYPSAEAAATDAALIRSDGQPAVPTLITWVSTPRFYRQDRLVVLYVSCSAAIVEALARTMGPAFAVGDTPRQLR